MELRGTAWSDKELLTALHYIEKERTVSFGFKHSFAKAFCQFMGWRDYDVPEGFNTQGLFAYCIPIVNYRSSGAMGITDAEIHIISMLNMEGYTITLNCDIDPQGYEEFIISVKGSDRGWTRRGTTLNHALIRVLIQMRLENCTPELEQE